MVWSRRGGRIQGQYEILTRKSSGNRKESTLLFPKQGWSWCQKVLSPFCFHFKYLGSWLSFYLRDDYDVGRLIWAANALMGALDKFWIYHHVDMYSKYMIFWEIPCNLLLWGCEIWSLRQSLIDKLDLFLHHSIRRILDIIIGHVRERHTKNSQTRTMFYNIPCMRYQVAFRQLTYVGKYCVARSLTYRWDSSLPDAITQGNGEANCWQTKTAWFGTSSSSYLGSTTPARFQCGDFIPSMRPTGSCYWPL